MYAALNFTQNLKLTIASKLVVSLSLSLSFFVSVLYHLLFSSPCRLFHAHFFGIFAHQSVTASHPANEPGSQLSCLPASQLSPLRTTDSREQAGFWKLMVHALLPGLKMDWNVVYLKHSRLLHRGKKRSKYTLFRLKYNFFRKVRHAEVKQSHWSNISLCTSFLQSKQRQTKCDRNRKELTLGTQRCHHQLSQTPWE